MRTAQVLLRISSVLLVLVGMAMGIAHAFRDDMASQEGRQVLDQMERPLDFDGTTRSYLRLYDGMSAQVVAMYLFLALALWILAEKIMLNPTKIRSILVATAVFLGINSVISFVFLFPASGIMQGIACVFSLYAVYMAYTLPAEWKRELDGVR